MLATRSASGSTRRREPADSQKSGPRADVHDPRLAVCLLCALEIKLQFDLRSSTSAFLAVQIFGPGHESLDRDLVWSETPKLQRTGQLRPQSAGSVSRQQSPMLASGNGVSLETAT
ncbi:hypothetical protein VTH06DRAFT_6079 [Thermothelomyces fergusii]